MKRKLSDKYSEIRIRNVDAAAVVKIDRLARERGMSRSEFLRRYLERLSVTPQLQEREDHYAALAQQTVEILQVMQEKIDGLEKEIRRGK